MLHFVGLILETISLKANPNASLKKLKEDIVVWEMIIRYVILILLNVL